jgi:hypothetical protein
MAQAEDCQGDLQKELAELQQYYSLVPNVAVLQKIGQLEYQIDKRAQAKQQQEEQKAEQQREEAIKQQQQQLQSQIEQRESDKQNCLNQCGIRQSQCFEGFICNSDPNDELCQPDMIDQSRSEHQNNCENLGDSCAQECRINFPPYVPPTPAIPSPPPPPQLAQPAPQPPPSVPASAPPQTVQMPYWPMALVWGSDNGNTGWFLASGSTITDADQKGLSDCRAKYASCSLASISLTGQTHQCISIAKSSKGVYASMGDADESAEPTFYDDTTDGKVVSYCENAGGTGCVLVDESCNER